MVATRFRYSSVNVVKEFDAAEGATMMSCRNPYPKLGGGPDTTAKEEDSAIYATARPLEGGSSGLCCSLAPLIFERQVETSAVNKLSVLDFEVQLRDFTDTKLS